MAQLPSAFNAGQHDKMEDFTPIPEGERVPVMIVKSEIKDTKAGDGKRLLLWQKVQSGEYKGKTVFIGLNIVNPNPTAVEIAQKELASICEACGKVTITDSQELHGIQFFATVGVEEQDGYPPRNFVKKYESVNAAIGDARAAKPKGNPFA